MFEENLSVPFVAEFALFVSDTQKKHRHRYTDTATDTDTDTDTDSDTATDALEMANRTSIWRMIFGQLSPRTINAV